MMDSFRMNVAKALRAVINVIGEDSKEVDNSIRPVLDKLTRDPDADVRDFAVSAIACKSRQLFIGSTTVR